MSGLSRTLVFVGLVLLGHAGYSAMQHRSFLKLAEEEYSGLPADIGMECLIASMLCCAGVVSSLGKFKDIKLTSELKTRSFETEGDRPSFITFNHRGQAVYDALR